MSASLSLPKITIALCLCGVWQGCGYTSSYVRVPPEIVAEAVRTTQPPSIADGFGYHTGWKAEDPQGTTLTTSIRSALSGFLGLITIGMVLDFGSDLTVRVEPLADGTVRVRHRRVRHVQLFLILPIVYRETEKEGVLLAGVKAQAEQSFAKSGRSGAPAGR